MNAINYFLGQKYIEAVNALFSGENQNQKFVIVPMEMASIAGTIAGIGELTREATAKQQAASAARPRSPTVPPAGNVS